MSPAASQIRTLEQKNEQRKKSTDSSPPVGKNDKWRNGISSSTKGRRSRSGYKNIGNRGESNFKPDLRKDYQTNNKLPRLQDIPRGTCVKCLSNQHVTPACNIYPHAAICREVCVVNDQPHGFHYHYDCPVKRDFNRANRDRRPKSDFYQNRNKQSRVFRPFRAQK